VIGAYLMTFHRERVGRFFSRAAAVDVLGALSIAIIVPASYVALSSPLFEAIPEAARKLYYSHHRDLFSVAVMFLILAAIHASGLLGRQIRRVLSWQGLFPVAQISYSLYLVHEMVMLWLFPKTAVLLGPSLGAYGTMAAASGISLVLSFGLATLLYLFVEQPSMRARGLPAVRRLTEPASAPPSLQAVG
jgi:peptidoglycan/LPS O-acetylase OafA/YrhL